MIESNNDDITFAVTEFSYTYISDISDNTARYVISMSNGYINYLSKDNYNRLRTNYAYNEISLSTEIIGNNIAYDHNDHKIYITEYGRQNHFSFLEANYILISSYY